MGLWLWAEHILIDLDEYVYEILDTQFLVCAGIYPKKYYIIKKKFSWCTSSTIALTTKIHIVCAAIDVDNKLAQRCSNWIFH